MERPTAGTGGCDQPDMPCENEFCHHHEVNSNGTIASWNKTKCSMYEVDPYEPDVQREFPGFRTDTCQARIRFMKMWAEERKWLKQKAG